MTFRGEDSVPPTGKTAPSRLFTGHGFWRYDLPTGSLVWWDSGSDQGRAAEFGEVDQTLIFDSIHPEDRPGFENAVMTAAVQGGEFARSFRFRGPAGEWRVISNLFAAQRDANGAVACVTGVVLDVTEIEICRTLSIRGSDIITQIDRAGVITYISPSVERVLGYRPEEMIGACIDDFVPGDALEAMREALRRASAPGGQDGLSQAHLPRHVQYRMRRKDGREVWLESQPIAQIDPSTGDTVGTTDVARDITAAKLADARLERAHSLLKTLIAASPIGILMVDQDHRLSAHNETFSEMWAIPREILESGDSGRVLDAACSLLDDPEAFRRDVNEVLTQDGPVWDEVLTRDGRWIDRYTVPVRAPDRAYLGRAWFFRDVTEHKRALAAAVRAARTDALTGLANRTVLMEALERTVAATQTSERRAALLHLDVDGLRDVNDTRGHKVGDLLLKLLAQRLREVSKPDWTLARLGSDEFAVLATDLAGPEAASSLAHQILARMAAPFEIEGERVHITVCIGVEFISGEAPEAALLLSHADMALHQSKAAGPGACRFFTDTMKTAIQHRVSLAGELREAIRSGQLFLLYQPAVSINGDQIVGMEALARWRHPERGVVGPDVFIPVAEKMGLIRDLGRWVLAEAMRQMRAWEEEGLPKIRMGVNVSALQFKSPELLETDVHEALAAADLPPWRLELELTESALMTASEGDLLSRLHRCGVRIAIDDFGTGYSSLDYLRRLPAQRVKIAQTFVRHLESSPGDAAIVKATIGLARDLGMSVIAEGVETESQLKRLRAWGCGECQGYFFDRPLSAEDAALRLRRGGYDDRRRVHAA